MKCVHFLQHENLFCVLSLSYEENANFLYHYVLVHKEHNPYVAAPSAWNLSFAAFT
jgi:hypothetical protein